MGGATLSVLTLIEAERKKHNKVYVATPNLTVEFKKIMADLGVEVSKLPIVFRAYPSIYKKLDYILWPVRLLRMLLFHHVSILMIKRIIKKKSVDIVHTNVSVISCGYEACRKTDAKHIWHIREYGDKDFNICLFPSKLGYKKKLMKSSIISITNALLLYHGLKEGLNTRVIYNGVRNCNEIFWNYPKKKYFLYASRISPEKGIDNIIVTFKEFHKIFPEYNLIILGFDPHGYLPHVIKLIKEYNLVNNVFIEGFKKDVSEYMSNATALIVASPFEGFGRMTAEAAFAGCMVVGMNSAGTKEILGITGGVTFNTKEEMLQALINVINFSHKDYMSMIKIAQEKAIEFFSKESYVNNVHNFYNYLLK